MKFIFFPSKGVLYSLLLVFLVLFFAAGLFVGQRNEQYIAVTGQRVVPIYRVDRPDKKIAITLDGTWGADYTDELLDIFSHHDLTVSFFFAGYWLEEYPEMAKKIANKGHEIGNHTYTHPHCTQISGQKLVKELTETEKLIEELTGYKPQFFRPPFGEYNDRVIRTARDLNYQVIQWSLDSLDWKEPGVEFIVDRILNNTGPGEIILMHNNAPHTPEALKKLIPRLQEKDFEIVPLSELVYKEEYEIQSHNGLQIKSVLEGNR